MRKSPALKKYPALILAVLFLAQPAGCFYRVNLEPAVSLKVDPGKYQPVALLPLQDPSGHLPPESGLYPVIHDSLEKKGYRLVKEAEVARALEDMKLTSLHLLSDRDSRKKMAEKLKAGLLMIGTLPEYRVQKSRLGSQSRQAWDGESYSDQVLPTFFWGISQIRLILRLFESDTGEMVWMSEGTIRASSDSAETYARKLAERLLKSLPPVPAPSAK